MAVPCLDDLVGGKLALIQVGPCSLASLSCDIVRKGDYRYWSPLIRLNRLGDTTRTRMHFCGPVYGVGFLAVETDCQTCTERRPGPRGAPTVYSRVVYLESGLSWLAAGMCFLLRSVEGTFRGEVPFVHRKWVRRMDAYAPSRCPPQYVVTWVTWTKEKWVYGGLGPIGQYQPTVRVDWSL